MIADGQPLPTSSSTTSAIASDVAIPDDSPPTARPAMAPAGVNPRHQIPSTRSGHSVDAAMAKTNPTVRDSSRSDAANEMTIASAPPIAAASRKSRTRPGSTSVDRAPATLMSRPDDVARNAAMAPAATSAANSSPRMPPTAALGSNSTAASAVPVMRSWGTYTRASTPRSRGKR
ncbi:Uncharacterised protein [Mycobacteroides abscessus subsp. abscessus]|nr:Uncharacterised protein [Mycobacteroides abscessus subsp. abscessus]